MTIPDRALTAIVKALLLGSLALYTAGTQAQTCAGGGAQVQVLGSGGPELDDRRASSSYLVWVNGVARLMVDTGGGSSYNFERSGADFDDIRAILFTHFHVDHSADLPVYIKGSFFTGRTSDLSIWGPGPNFLMPGADGFVAALFGDRGGAFRYLSDYFDAEVQAPITE